MKAALKKLLKNYANGKVSDAASNEGLKKGLIVTGVSSIGLFFGIIIIVIIVVFGPFFMAVQYIENTKNNVSLFLEKLGNVLTFQGWCADSDGSCDSKAEQKYYDKLDDVYDEYYKDGVEIDVELLSGTLFYGDYNNDAFDINYDGKDNDVKDLAKHMVSNNRLDYGKYRNYLVDTYIEKRFDNLIDKSDKDNSIESIADEIMSFASMGTSVGEGSNDFSNSVYEECNQVCTTAGKCFSLEEFVIRVVDHESSVFYNYTSNYAEMWRAHSIVARTATLNFSKTCTEPIELGNNIINILDPNSPNSRHDLIAKEIKETNGKILTYNGELALGAWDSFGKSNNYHCDDEFCYSNYYKVNKLWDSGIVHEVKSYKKWQGSFLGGNNGSNPGNGMSQYGAAYLADIGWKYEDIVKYFYDDNVQISKLTTVSNGYISSGNYHSNTPVYSNPSEFFSNINYNYFQPPSYPYYGECPWYAKGRSIEILSNSNIPDSLKNNRINFLRNMLGNGADWYNNPSNDLFSKSTDLYAAKPGSIVSWKGGSVSCPESPMGLCGHVGIIEDVEYDSNGKAVRVLLTDGWNDRRTGVKIPNYSSRWIDMEALRRYSTRNTYYFNGYVYLLD